MICQVLFIDGQPEYVLTNLVYSDGTPVQAHVLNGNWGMVFRSRPDNTISYGYDEREDPPAIKSDAMVILRVPDARSGHGDYDACLEWGRSILKNPPPSVLKTLTPVSEVFLNPGLALSLRAASPTGISHVTEWGTYVLRDGKLVTLGVTYGKSEEEARLRALALYFNTPEQLQERKDINFRKGLSTQYIDAIVDDEPFWVGLL